MKKIKDLKHVHGSGKLVHLHKRDGTFIERDWYVRERDVVCLRERDMVRL